MMLFFVLLTLTCSIKCHAEQQQEEFKSLENPTSYRRNYQSIPLASRFWKCQNKKCTRYIGPDESEVKSSEIFHYLEGCKSVCGDYGSLWPMPTGETRIKSELKAFDIEDVAFKLDAKEQTQALDEIITEAWSIFSQYLALKSPKGIMLPSQKKKFEAKRAHVLVKISIKSSDLKLALSTDESYTLSVNTRLQGEFPRDEIVIHILAASFYGARHALETLSQLITFDPFEACHRIPAKVQIQDKPAFPYRGILLDTGRNYYSISSLKRIIDGLSYNKLNVLHWHIIDQQSFPFVSERVPNLTRFGAYSSDQVYYKDEIKGLVMYARQRGVLLLPEFDGPAHASQGWQFGPQSNLGELVSCFGVPWEDEYTGTLAAEPPSGQLNPVNENVYRILNDVYQDFVEAFTPMYDKAPLSMFHMGGDEVNFKCWAKDPAIRQWLSQQGLETDPTFSPDGYLYLWSIFQERALRALNKANKKTFQDGIILWTSELTKPSHISKFLDASKYVIQVWTKGSDPQIGELLKQKYRVIMSNYDAWYLDCGYGAWLYSDSGPENNWCAPFKGWKTVYKNNFRHMLAAQGLDWSTFGKLILGGEATMWSEQSDEFTVEPKLWPRSSAFAERLWSDPQSSTWKDAEQRLLEQRRRLVSERGLQADAIMPEYCRQNDGDCYTLKKMAITFEEQLNQNAFVNEPFTLPPHHHPASASKQGLEMSFMRFLSLKFLLLIFFLAIIFFRRRSIMAAISNCFRSVKFVSIA